MNTECPAYLIHGNVEDCTKYANNILKQIFCNKECSGCLQCHKIKNKTHENIIWLEPEKDSYTKIQLNIIFEKCSFALENGEQFFFVIQHADLLNASCANSLLKTLEEPPSGYKFLLLTNRIQEILATIKSRCIVKELSSNNSDTAHPLFSLLIQEVVDPIKILQTLEQTSITETESIMILEQLMTYWTKQLKSQMQNNQDFTIAENKINLISKLIQKPPMAGSSKIFWKNVVIGLVS